MTAAETVVRLAAPEDQAPWDAYVQHHPEASPYHYFAWRRAVEEAYGHRCAYLYGARQGRLVGVLPLVHLRLVGLVNAWTALPYCDVGGCLSDDEAAQDALLARALEIRRAHRGGTLSLRGPLRPTELQRAALHDENSGKVRMLLDLPGSSAELLAGFKSKLRNQIGRAERNGVSFRWGGLDDMNAIYGVFAENMHQLGSPVHARGWLEAILRHYGRQARAGLAEFKGKVIGMGIILLASDSVSIPWASTLRPYNHLGPNMLLYWNFLKFGADQGFQRFDFGRSTPDEGTYKFKKQWGARPQPLLWYCDKPSPARPPGPGHGKQLLAGLWRRLPLAAANRIGPHLRKYISL